ncbi:hypothetical protein B0H16DRAFT_1747647 [Mycena metata]|uniref:Uncharacterized protein n=1 Tax=Mycena metata TaxID=1033252 RepID=A0AAD7GSC9_9AGAR|nr:hypothetical protein B0H16DRAFT_1747647 [Mycena metata]
MPVRVPRESSSLSDFDTPPSWKRAPHLFTGPFVFATSSRLTRISLTHNSSSRYWPHRSVPALPPRVASITSAVPNDHVDAKGATCGSYSRNRFSPTKTRSTPSSRALTLGAGPDRVAAGEHGERHQPPSPNLCLVPFATQ